MAVKPHRGVDLQPSTGVHMHQPLQKVQASLPRPQIIKQMGLVLSSPSRQITLNPTELTFNAEGFMGMQVVSATISDAEFDAKLKRTNSAEELQFLRDQVDNYSDDISEDFAAGILAAITIFSGEKFLEDYLGDS